MRTTPAFGHVDADCYYVSAERVRNAYKDEASGYDICDIRGKICF
jgi:hypothetical protein